MKNTDKVIKRITFFGDGDLECKNKKHYRKAKKLAKILAKNGYIIVNGGGPGVMRAATDGAKAGKGRVEVVILDENKEPDNYEGVDRENLKKADKIVRMPTYESRIKKLMELGDAFVVFKGGTGTLSEVGMAWNRAKYDFGHHEPLIFFGREWKKIIKNLIKGLDLEDKEKQVVRVVTRAKEVVKILDE